MKWVEKINKMFLRMDMDNIDGKKFLNRDTGWGLGLGHYALFQILCLFHSGILGYLVLQASVYSLPQEGILDRYFLGHH